MQDKSDVVSAETTRHVLGDASLQSVANYILSNDVRDILVLVGAGISVGAGIPDFRSPTHGIYANLSRYELDEPSDAFSLNLLRERPHIFYAIANDMNLWPGNYKPTAVHYFIRLLAEEGRLLRCCTQNIDGLERAAGIPEELLVEAHGTFSRAACIDCHEPCEVAMCREESRKGQIPHCLSCGGIVKPAVVFFGEQLPDSFTASFTDDPPRAKLVIIIGTSLQVHPFAAFPLQVDDSVPRIVINRERVGGYMFRFPSDPPLPRRSSIDEISSEVQSNDGSSSSSDGYAQYGSYDAHPECGRDAFFPGDCQETICSLAHHLHLDEKLRALMNSHL